MERVERKVLKLFGHVERIGEKDWMRQCIGQLWERETAKKMEG